MRFPPTPEAAMRESAKVWNLPTSSKKRSKPRLPQPSEPRKVEPEMSWDDEPVPRGTYAQELKQMVREVIEHQEGEDR